MAVANPSAAAMALGYNSSGSASSLFGGASVGDQLANESEEERKRRLAALQASQQGVRPGGLGSGYSGAISAAGSALGLS
jgi:hypothetical protein